eukprot:4554893-Prymnesium_polylepis.1
MAAAHPRRSTSSRADGAPAAPLVMYDLRGYAACGAALVAHAAAALPPLMSDVDEEEGEGHVADEDGPRAAPHVRLLLQLLSL